MFVLAFDRDWTVDVNPHPNREAVPLSWVRYWAHETDHEVWAIGNQDLVEEADIPGTVECIRQRDGDITALGEQDEAGYYEWWPERDERLNILLELFPDADQYIVVDDIDLSHVGGWDHYYAWDFTEKVRQGDIPLDTPADTHRTDGGHESEEAVRDVLDRGWLFELTYQVDGDERTFLVTHREPDRPSMKPLKGPPTFYFDTLAGGQTHKVRLPEIVDVTPASAEHVPSPLSTQTLSAMRDVVEEDPESVSLTEIEETITTVGDDEAEVTEALHLARITLQEREEAIEELGDSFLSLLEKSESAVGRAVLKRFITQAQDSPETITPLTSQIASLAAVSPYEEGAVRCLVVLADADPTYALDAVPALATAAESNDTETRQWAIYALTLIADEHPEELLPAVGVLTDAIRTTDDSTRANALSALGKITSSFPDAAEPIAEHVAELLDADKELVRSNAVGLLGDIARQHPDVVIEFAGPIADCLDDSNLDARVNASITLLTAGEADPDAVRVQHERLEGALDDPDPTVRANACTLIGNAHAQVAVEKLQELQETDPDDDVREQAAWALSRLS